VAPAPPLPAVARAAPLGSLLARVAHRVARGIESTLDGSGLTLDQWRVLDLLSDGRGHPMSEIAGHVLVPPPTLTKIVDRLVENALVHRRVDDADRRRVLVLASEHGADLHRRLAPAVTQVETDVAAELDEAEVMQLMQLLGRLAARPIRGRPA
jgi:DNA-binding MarR family transcriptional regulator